MQRGLTEEERRRMGVVRARSGLFRGTTPAPFSQNVFHPDTETEVVPTKKRGFYLKKEGKRGIPQAVFRGKRLSTIFFIAHGSQEIIRFTTKKTLKHSFY